MTTKALTMLAALVALSSANGGCRDSSFLDSNDGNLGAPCHADGTCNAGLYCAAAVCEPLPDGTPRPDAQPRADAAIAPDAAAPVDPFGSIAVLDISDQGHPELGWGGFLSVSFMTSAEPMPAYDDRDETGLGCRAWVYDDNLPGSMPPPLVDQGRLRISGAGVAVPLCNFHPPLASPLATNGYDCLFTASDGFLTPTGVGGIVRLDDPLQTFGTNVVGAQAIISGAANAATNGMHPVVGAVSGALELYNPAQTVAGGAAYRLVGAAGPAPGTPDFLVGGEIVTIRMDGDQAIPAFARGIAAGSAFSLAASTDLTAIDPTSPAPLTLAAQPDNEGSGALTLVALDTSDGDTSGVDANSLPPAHRAVRVRCASSMAGVTIPAEVLALIDDTGPTRIRTTLLRVNNSVAENISLLVGHAYTGLTEL